MVVKYFVKLTAWISMASNQSELEAAANSQEESESQSPGLRASQKLLGSQSDLNDWEWVRSPREEYAIKISLENALRIERELKELKKTASSIKLRKYFFNKCSKYMNSLSAEERKILQIPLDAPKRSAIIKAAIKLLEQTWLEFIREQFFLRQNLANSSVLLPPATTESTSSTSSSSSFRAASSPSSSSLNCSTSSTASNYSSTSLCSSTSSNFSTTSASPMSFSSGLSAPVSVPSCNSSTRLSSSPLSEAMILSNSPAIFSDESLSSSPSSSPPTWPPEMPLRTSSSSVATASPPPQPKKGLKVSGTWEIFANSYQEQAYEKNIAGSMASVGFQASHGAQGDQGLTPRILGDIVWSVFSTLSHAICQSLRKDFMEPEDMQMLARNVLQLQEPLIELWIQTIKVSRVGVRNEGRLTAQWKAEEEEKQQRLMDIKRKGVDARWFDDDRKKRIAVANAKRRMRGEDADPDDEEMEGSSTTNNLLIIEDYQPHPGREDFLKAKKLLEATLFGRFSPRVTAAKRKPPTLVVPQNDATASEASQASSTAALPRLRVKLDLSTANASIPVTPFNAPSPLEEVPLDDPAEEEGFENVHIEEQSQQADTTSTSNSSRFDLGTISLEIEGDADAVEETDETAESDDEGQAQLDQDDEEAEAELLLELELATQRTQRDEVPERAAPRLRLMADDSIVLDYGPVRQSSLELEHQMLHPMIAASDRSVSSSAAF